MVQRKRWIEPALVLACLAVLLSLLAPKEREVEELGFSLRPVIPTMQLENHPYKTGFGLGVELKKFEPLLGAYDVIGVYPLNEPFPAYDPTKPKFGTR